MAVTTIADIEQQVFLEIVEGDDGYEDTYWQTYDVDDLRSALGDAIDELSARFNLFKYDVAVPLVENVGIYSISLENAYPFYIKRAKLWESDRRLTPDTLMGLSQKDRQFLVSRGSPHRYVPLCSDKFLVWPVPNSSADIVRLEVVGCPAHYDDYQQYLPIREELEQALVHYGKYSILLMEGGGFIPAMEEYLEYLRLGQFNDEFKHTQRLIHQARMRNDGLLQ